MYFTYSVIHGWDIQVEVPPKFVRGFRFNPLIFTIIYQQLDFWKQPHKGDIHIHVSPKVEKKFTETLQRAGLKYKVLENDIQR